VKPQQTIQTKSERASIPSHGGVSLPPSVGREQRGRILGLVFYYDSGIKPIDCDLPRILTILEELGRLGIDVRTVDTVGFSESERTDAYLDAIVGAVIRQAAIRQIFGSRRNSGFLFGKVPALLVYDKSYTPPICVDIYPQRQSIIDGATRSIESYLDNALKTLEPSAGYRHYIDGARRALQTNLGAAAILYAVLAIDGLIWRALWGKTDIVWIGVDGRRHKWSSVDFVSQYALRGASDFPNPEQLEKLKERNKRLFKKLRDSDSFLLGQAVRIGLVKDSERDIVEALRSIRNVCAHFSPYEVTLSRYRAALHGLGITAQPSIGNIEEVAQVVVEKAASILTIWESRLTT